MSASDGFSEKTVDVNDRRFVIRALAFENGHFVSVTEGQKKLGATVASLAMGPRPVTTTVIPAKSESFFIKLMAERICTKTNGIAVVSAFFQRELDNSTAKSLISEVTEFVSS